MNQPDACSPDGEPCITCGDIAVPMVVFEPGADGIAVCVDPAGDLTALHEVATDLVGPVGAGDELLVHAGVAISRQGVGFPEGEAAA